MAAGRLIAALAAATKVSAPGWSESATVTLCPSPRPVESGADRAFNGLNAPEMNSNPTARKSRAPALLALKKYPGGDGGKESPRPLSWSWPSCRRKILTSTWPWWKPGLALGL